MTPPATTTPAVNTVAGMSSIPPSGPVSFAAVAAAGTNKAKENILKSSLSRSGPGAQPALGQSQLENVNSLYQKFALLMPFFFLFLTIFIQLSAFCNRLNQFFRTNNIISSKG